MDKYGVEVKNEDVVEMCLDMNTLVLSFSVNGIDYGKAFDVKQAKYRAFIVLGKKGNKIQLLPNNR